MTDQHTPTPETFGRLVDADGALLPTPDSAHEGDPCASTAGQPASTSPGESSASGSSPMPATGNSASPGSTQSPDSAGWIQWKGGECPVAPDAEVDFRFRSGRQLFGYVAFGLEWEHVALDHDIVAYRLSDRLADERSALKSPNSSDPSAIAGARERPDQTDVDCAVSELHEILQYAELVDGPALPRVLQFPQVHVRTLLADHARLGGLVDELQGLLVTHEIAAEAKSRRALTNREGQDNG